MEEYLSILGSFLNPLLFGILISVTIRWGILHYAASKLRKNMRGPLDRMIEVTSDEILKGIIRKRKKQVKSIMCHTENYAMTRISEKVIKMPEITQDDISSIYNSFKEHNLSLYLIPNEDIYTAQKERLLLDTSHYYLNDEIITRLSNREMQILENKEKQEKENKQRFLKEKQEKQKEQEIEDSINI